MTKKTWTKYLIAPTLIASLGLSSLAIGQGQTASAKTNVTTGTIPNSNVTFDSGEIELDLDGGSGAESGYVDEVESSEDQQVNDVDRLEYYNETIKNIKANGFATLYNKSVVREIGFTPLLQTEVNEQFQGNENALPIFTTPSFKRLADYKLANKTIKVVQNTGLGLQLQTPYFDLVSKFIKEKGLEKDVLKAYQGVFQIKVVTSDNKIVVVNPSPNKETYSGTTFTSYSLLNYDYIFNKLGTYKLQFTDGNGAVKSQTDLVVYKGGTPIKKTLKLSKIVKSGTDRMKITTQANETTGVQYKYTYKKPGAKTETLLKDYSSTKAISHKFPTKAGNYTYYVYMKYNNSPKAKKYSKTVTLK